ncbi:MAG: phosphoribosyl-AMP cyclohydrolase [Akkermansiaceae bacterium]|jgi:phosphoribosyl-AMP cyclohydrolase|tara:strand:- start:2192 stop:2683 length:492 start_codon:yes stop_codon:yes gene_type:complete
MENKDLSDSNNKNTSITFGPSDDKKVIEEQPVFAPKFDSDGLIPAMAMDATTKEPLMLAYMNEKSLVMTLEIGEAVYYSRSRQEIWHKGATSGHVQKIVDIRTDCDQDTLILYVEQIGAGACHTGRSTCFYRSVDLAAGKDPAALKFTETDLTFDPNAVYGDK